MPELISVAIPDGRGGSTSLAVAIEKPEKTKGYIGGYKHVQSGVEYHHAVSQTPKIRDPNAPPPATKFHRDTQTYDMKARSTQSKRDFGTQMAKNGLYISTEHDKVM